MANGPAKTMGLARFSSKFWGSQSVFFSGYVHLAVSIFFKAKKSGSTNLCVFSMNSA